MTTLETFYPFKVTDPAFAEFRALWTREQCETMALQHILCDTPVRELAILWVNQHHVFETGYDGGKRVSAITSIMHAVEQQVLAMKMERNLANTHLTHD